MTPTERDLMQLASTGQKLARVDDVDYLAVHVVLACPPDGAPALYCTYADWTGTHAARLAAKDKAIAELEETLGQQAAESLKQFRRAESALARVKELEAQLAIVPAQNQAAQFRAQAASLNDAPSEPPESIVCPDCGKDGWKNAHALDVHRGRAHAPKQLVGDDAAWRCAEPHCTGAFTRDLHNPAYCTQHAKIHATANGHEVAAS